MNVLNKLTSSNKKLLISSSLIILLSGLLAAYFYKSVVLFPSTLNVHVENSSTKLLTLYYATDRGFRESERSARKLSGKQEIIKLGLPLRTVKALRLDLDNGGHSITISKLCFASLWEQQCWPSQQLNKQFSPLNGIADHKAHNNALQISTIGKDPHFSFRMDSSSAHLKVARPGKTAYLLFSMLLVTALFVAAYFCYQFVLPWIIKNYHLARDSGFYIPLGPAVALVAFFSMLVSGILIIIYNLGAHIYLPMLFVLLFLVLNKSEQGFRASSYIKNLGYTLCKGDWKQAVFVSLLLLLPVSWLMLQTWGQDFPNVGDHEYHFWSNHVAYYAIERNKEFFLFTLLGGLFAFAIGRIGVFIIAAALLLVLAGGWDITSAIQASDTQGTFSRYPGGTRLLAYPFVYLSFLYEWDSPLNVGRLVNYLAVPIWLLVLRPLVIGKWPGWSLLPFALLFFYQTETIYFFTSAYLDMWCVIFIALALEKLLLDDNENAYFKACLLLAVACAFKEPAVFIIPWFWLAGKPWQYFGRKGGLKRLWDAILVGIASVLPFIIYYLVRKGYGTSRYTYKGTEYFLTEAWFAEMANRLQFHFGTAGMYLMGLLLLVWLYCLFSQNWRIYRVKLLCILGAAISLTALFNLDQGGVAFTGYFRFYLPVFLLLLAPSILLVKNIDISQTKQLVSLVIACLIILLGNGPRLVEYLSFANQHDATRNFTEHYDAPIFLPIRSLIERAEQEGALNKGQVSHIHVNHVTGWNQPDFAYPQLDRKYNLRMLQDIVCECSDYNKVVLSPFVYYAGLNKNISQLTIEQIDDAPQQVAKYAKRWRQVNELKPQCLAKLKNSCDYYHEEKINDEVVGAIGVLK